MELLRALAVLSEPPVPGVERVAATLGLPGRPTDTDYTDLFVFQLYPYASVYTGPEGKLGGEAGARVAGFWTALGLEPPPEPDHLASLLGLYAGLAESEREAGDTARGLMRRQARAALLHEHLLPWLPSFLAKAEEIGAPFYRQWARLLRRAIMVESHSLEPLGRLPLHLREAPALVDPRNGGAEAFLDALLALAGSGMILVRDDLARAASELGLGLRLAERRFALRALLEQDATATLGWLGREANAWQEHHRLTRVLAPEAANFLAERAGAAAALLEDLATAAREEALAHAR